MRLARAPPIAHSRGSLGDTVVGALKAIMLKTRSPHQRVMEIATFMQDIVSR